MESFLVSARKAKEADDIDYIMVKSYASPDGQQNANEKLAVYRSEELSKYLVKTLDLNPLLIHTQPEGIAWDELKRMVEQDPNVPSRNKILDILNTTPLWVKDASGNIIDGRKKRLMEIDYGNPYRWMMANIFPKLRSGVMVSLYLKSHKINGNGNKQPSLMEENSSIKSLTNANNEHKQDKSDSSSCVKATQTDSLLQKNSKTDKLTQTDNNSEIKSRDSSSFSKRDYQSPEPLHRFALKTNFLYYAALMPNVELQWRINPQWALSLEGNVAWYKKDAKHKYYQIAMISPEIRRWIKPRKEWHGMYAGLFAAGTWYDLENGRKGQKGEGVGAGLSFGYMWPISRTLSLETGIGVGYLYTRYKVYLPYEGHYLYQRTKSLNYFGPMKLKFSIVWRFDDINKAK